MSNTESNSEIALLRNERENLRTQLANLNEAYNSLLVHTNETERRLDDAAELLGEIIKSGTAYAESTDKSSVTGRKIAALLEYVAQFQAEPHQVENEDH